MSRELILITSITCNKCPAAKQYMKDQGLEHKVLTVGGDGNQEAMTYAMDLKIFSVPAVVVIEDEGATISAYPFDDFKQIKFRD